ncbi:MAG: CBS domain-containing protein [Thermodesulfobacteriota bacterium]|nr:CBS domain-containing protein [Thermodesulfobacteriota bacterium]
MITVRDIMTSDPITVTPDTEITQAAKILVDKGINGLPVVDESGDLVGIICQSDLISQQKKFPIPTFFTLLDGFIPTTTGRQLEKEIKKITAVTVDQAMTLNPTTISPDDDITTLAGLMVDKNYHTIPVVEDGKLVGVVGKEDVLKTITT